MVGARRKDEEVAGSSQDGSMKTIVVRDVIVNRCGVLASLKPSVGGGEERVREKEFRLVP